MNLSNFTENGVNMISGNIILRILVFSILLSISSYTAVASSVSVDPSPQVVSAGDTFTVDVFVEPDVAIAGMQFNLEFDGTKMHVVDVAEGNLFTQSGMGTYFNAGTIESGSVNNVYGTILGAANVKTPSVFATITLVVDAQDTTTSTINLKNVIVSDPEGNAIEFEVINAIVGITDTHDVNGDGTVSFTDYEIVEQYFSEETSAPYPSWDVNSDGVVNIMDLTLVIFNLD